MVCKPEPKVVVLYGSMWGATEQMARTILEGAQECEVEAQLFDVESTHMTRIVTDILDCAAVAIGSSTLNNTILPSVASVMCYIKGLRPAQKKGFAFGSYGWSKAGGANEVGRMMDEMKIERIGDPIRAQYKPTPEMLEQCREAGRELGKIAESYK